MGGEDVSVFVSYARADWAAVEPVVVALREAGVGVWVDTTSIEPTAEWWAEIVQAIEASDATIAFLSQAFLGSAVCRQEVGAIRERGKKLIPVVIGEVAPEDLPDWASAIQWISAKSGATPDVVDDLRRAIDVDLAWSSEHARLLVRAREWDERGRPRSRLLRAKDIAAAEAAVVQDRPPSQPQPTALQREYVAASRRNRGRLVMTIAVVATVVSLVTTALAVVALRQRETALEALADSDFRRLSAQSEAATTQSDGLRLALGALERAGAAGRSDSEAVVPLARALGRTDVPLMHFSGLVAPDSYTGGQQGTDVSGDGSTFAYVLSDGSVRVIDLWTLAERAVIEPFTGSVDGFSIGYQVGLDRSGTRLVRVFVPEYPEGGERFQADLEIFDLADDTAERTLAETVELSSYPAAVAFGPQDEVVVVPEVEGTVSVVDLGGDRPEAVHLGTPEFRTDASLLEVFVTVDGSRVCTIGENLQLYQVAEPKQLLEVANDRFTYRCMPEPCGVSTSNVMAMTRESDLQCIAPDGSVHGRADANVLAGDPTLVALRGVDPDWKPGNRHRWLVEQPNGEAVDPPYWFVTAPDEMVRSLGISYAVPMPGGPGIVSVGVDGDIDVWAIGSGVLPDENELVAADAVSFLVGGQSLSSDRPPLALALEGTVAEATGDASVVNANSGEPVTPVRSLDLGDTWYDQRHWVLPGGEILVHGADGHVEVHAEGDVRPTEYDLDVAEDDALDDPPMAVEGDLLAHSTGDSIDVVDARSGERRLSTSPIDGNYCAVGASQGATRLAAVTCGTGEKAELQIWDDLHARQPTRRLPLVFSSPNAVTLSDDGRTVAVAFTFGEVAVLRDGRWVEPPELMTGGADHNDFQRGWVDLDPLGRWMVTRRDGHGVELWHLAGDGVERVSRLSFEWRWDAPISSRFDADSLSLLWNEGTGSSTSLAVGWSLTERSLRRHACLQIAGVIEAVEASESRDVPRDVCERGRDDEARPDAAPITTTPNGDPVEAAALGRLDFTTIPLAAGSSPSEVGVAGDGATWVAASSMDSLVRIDSSGAVASYPIGDTETSVHSLVPAGRGAMWFAGFQTFGQVDPDGRVGLLPGFDDPSAAILVGDTVFAYVAAGPSFLRATEAGVDVVPLAAELAGLEVSAMAPADDSSVWLGLTTSLDGSHGPALVRVPLDGGEVLERIELDEIATLGSLVRGSDGGLWFAGTSEDQSGVLGHRSPGGQVELLEPAGDVVPAQLLASPDDVWFVSETHLGRVSVDDNSMTVWPVPGAERLTGIALAPDGSFWLTDGSADVVHHVMVEL